MGTRAANADVAAKGNGAKLLTAADAVVRGCPAAAGGGATKLDTAGMIAAAVVAFVPAVVNAKELFASETTADDEEQ